MLPPPRNNLHTPNPPNPQPHSPAPTTTDTPPASASLGPRPSLPRVLRGHRHARRASQVEERVLEVCAKDLIGFLLAHGADPLARNHKGVTPLMVSGIITRAACSLMMSMSG